MFTPPWQLEEVLCSFGDDIAKSGASLRARLLLRKYWQASAMMLEKVAPTRRLIENAYQYQYNPVRFYLSTGRKKMRKVEILVLETRRGNVIVVLGPFPKA
jgi:hypothetical protein